ncbi:MAG: hypothetical protein RMI00_01920 [Sulfolobales archaeon]|nr:hypothetical protein [Acidilobaceae archaeon]MDW7974010.1 hypothetical protein [Sulfolobales archaeon]
MSVIEAIAKIFKGKGRDSEEIYLLPTPLERELLSMSDLGDCCARRKESYYYRLIPA